MGRRLLACFGKGGSSSGGAKETQAHEKNATADVSAEEMRRGGAVLVELFSSQGCKTSPEAEILVSRLGRGDFELGVPVIVLAYHVDYWDYMGWKDPYGSSQWTVRQKAYVEALNLDTMFTPQLVFQGRVQCQGNDQDGMLSAIANAPKFPAPSFQVSMIIILFSHILFFVFCFFNYVNLCCKVGSRNGCVIVIAGKIENLSRDANIECDHCALLVPNHSEDFSYE